MSITFTKALANNLAVGAVVTVDFRSGSTGIYLPPTYQQQANNKTATLLIFNESGYGFTFTMGSASSQSKPLPAGGWRSISLPNDVQTLTLTVVYVLPNAPTNTLIIEFCQAGETPDDTGFLGNSPIGLSAVSLPVTQVIQDGQPNGQVIVEATPTGQPQNVLITTDGIARLVEYIATISNSGGGTIGLALNTPNLAAHNGDAFTILNGQDSNQTTFGVGDGTHSSFGAGLWAYDKKNNGTIFKQGLNTGIFFVAPFSGVGNQATVGSFGVPVIVAQAIRTAVTVTGDQVILSFAPPAVGKYRVSGYASENNGSATTITFRFTWSDPDNGGTSTGYFTAGVAGTQTDMNALSFGAGPNNFHTSSHDIVANIGTNIIVHWNNSAGTPNDHITVQIERLA